MEENQIVKPFTHPFLSTFILAPHVLPFQDEEIISLDAELSKYEQIYLHPDIEKNLISKNELLASFAISKAENSLLTLKEAQDVYNLVLTNTSYDFIADKMKAKQKLTQKDHDKLEFYNIAKTFRTLNEAPCTTEALTPDVITSIHRQLTQGLDIFNGVFSGFTVYKSGVWRDNDLIRVGEYIPAPFNQIREGVDELIEWLKGHATISGIAVFHTALYALHPFNNGNKRVCRVLEHLLLRGLGINGKNLYSTSYYYHKEKPRYYKYLLASLERKNLNHFVSFVEEAIVLSIISVLKTSIEVKRAEFMNKQQIDGQMYLALKPLIKRQEVQYKNLFRYIRNKMARQTFVNYLQKAVEREIITKREIGRATYYQLSVHLPEEKTLGVWIALASKRLDSMPKELVGYL